VLIIGNTRQPFLCEKGDLKKFNAFFKDFKLFVPMPDYAAMQVLCLCVCVRASGVCVCVCVCVRACVRASGVCV
jgi:hypothetical protein